MSGPVALMIFGLCCCALAVAYDWRLRTQRLLKFEKAADAFFERIKPLIEDDETPDCVLDFISFLNRWITTRSASRTFFLHLMRRRGNSLYPDAAKKIQEMRSFFDRRPGLRHVFEEACMEAIFAMSYQAPVFGFILRRLVFFDLPRHQDRAPDLVASLRVRSQHAVC